jgi:hypothetical protein
MFRTDFTKDPLEAEQVVAPVLGSDEELLWSGRPRSGIIFHRVDALLIPFSMVWAGLALFWEAAVIRAGAPVLMALAGLPFVGIGCYMMFGRFFADAVRRERTYYALTDKRALIVTKARRALTIKEHRLGALVHLSVRAKSDGSGTIVFGTPQQHPVWLAGTAWPSVGEFPAFEAIENVQELHDRLRRAQSKAG